MKKLILLLILSIQFCWSMDTYDPISEILTIEKVAVGNNLYSNVKVKVTGVIEILNGTSIKNAYDYYDQFTNRLTIPAVTVGNITYHNAKVTIGNVISLDKNVDNTFLKPSINDSYYQNAWIDFRFDLSGIGGAPTVEGFNAQSLPALQIMLDRIKLIGFNTVSFMTQLAIDPSTGDIFNPQKPLPKDFWKVIDYAKEIGLNVFIVVQATDPNDNVLATSPLGPNFSSATLFKSLNTFHIDFDSKAQSHNVDGIYIGQTQITFDNLDNIQNWQNLIQNIKTIFKGKILYMASYDSPVFNLVDIISYAPSFALSITPNNNVTSLINAYSNSSNGINYLKDINSFVKKYSKPVILDFFRTQLADSGVGYPINIWATLMSGNNVSVFPSNWDVAAAKVQSFCAISTKINPLIVGIGFDEFQPWAQQIIFQKALPGTSNYNWYLVDSYGIEIYKHLQIEQTINECFSKSLVNR
jgi:hypothetical protein